MALLILLKVSGYWSLKRYSFDYTSLGKQVLEELNSSKNSLAIIGTTSSKLIESLNNIKSLYPNLNIVYSRHGYFEGKKQMDETIGDLIKINPKFVIAGMGTPLQEQFLVELKKQDWKGTGFTCGGFLHQSAKSVQYYPSWINKLSMRWIYRIYDEPKLFKRYFLLYPFAFLILIKDILKSKFWNN